MCVPQWYSYTYTIRAGKVSPVAILLSQQQHSFKAPIDPKNRKQIPYYLFNWIFLTPTITHCTQAQHFISHTRCMYKLMIAYGWSWVINLNQEWATAQFNQQLMASLFPAFSVWSISVNAQIHSLLLWPCCFIQVPFITVFRSRPIVPFSYRPFSSLLWHKLGCSWRYFLRR